jgi:hypothetical protein
MPAADDRIAIHESAHVLLATALGLPVRFVQLGDDPCYRLERDPRPDQRVAEILVLMAGCAGEEIFHRTPLGGGSDDPQIARLLTAADDEASLRRQVRLFIAANYPAVRRIADALLRNGMLTGDEVEAIVRGKTFRRGHP